MKRADVEALYGRMRERAERAARRVAHDPGVVNDAVDHALEKVWQRHESLDRERVLSWVGAVAYNKALDEERRRARHDTLSQSEEGPAGTQWHRAIPRLGFSATERVTYGLVRMRALRLLPEGQAAALRLHLDGLTGPEVAERLEISLAAAKKRVHDAKENLRVVLGDDLDDLIPAQRHW